MQGFQWNVFYPFRFPHVFLNSRVRGVLQYTAWGVCVYREIRQPCIKCIVMVYMNPNYAEMHTLIYTLFTWDAHHAASLSRDLRSIQPNCRSPTIYCVNSLFLFFFFLLWTCVLKKYVHTFKAFYGLAKLSNKAKKFSPAFMVRYAVLFYFSWNLLVNSCVMF